VADLARVAIYPRAPYNPVSAESRGDFFDSLYHSAAVVGVNTSAMIEAAIVGRPVCSLLAPEFAGTQEGTIHFHHLLPENGGFLRIAATIEAHVEQLASCLRDPAAARLETERFVASFIRPHGIERPATAIVADAIERLGAAPRSAAAAPSPPSLVGVVLVAAMLPVAGLQWLTEPGMVARQRKRVGSLARRGRKRLARAGTRWKRYVKEAW
jgi:hypothetical protein